SSRRRHTSSYGDWSSDVCSSDLGPFADAELPTPIANAQTQIKIRVTLMQLACNTSCGPAASSFRRGSRNRHARRVRSPICEIRVIRGRCRSLIDDFETHLTGGAGNDAEGGFIVARVEVFALGVHDVHDLFARDFA